LQKESQSNHQQENVPGASKDGKANVAGILAQILEHNRFAVRHHSAQQRPFFFTNTAFDQKLLISSTPNHTNPVVSS
jgi:hypothetical protein